MEDLAEKLNTIVETSSTPTLTLLKSITGEIPVNIQAFLNNPKEIGAYEGGEVKANIQTLTQEQLIEYTTNINTSIHSLESKIMSTQSYREIAINLLGAAPSWIGDGLLTTFGKIMEWFPGLSKIFAALFGKKDFSEFMSSNREELIRSRSIHALKKYGLDEKGKPRESKIHGKIEMLKDVDLSKLDRVRLRPFFKTLQSE